MRKSFFLLIFVLLIFNFIQSYDLLTKDKAGFTVCSTHFLTTDRRFGGCIEYKDGKHSLDKMAAEEFIFNAANNGCNIFRFLSIAPFTDCQKPELLTPFILESGKYNLHKLNPIYFDVLQDIKSLCQKYNNVIFFDIFDQVQGNNTPILNRLSPYRRDNNVQGIKDYQSLPESVIRPLIKRIVKTIGTDGIIYSVGNEIALVGNYEQSKTFYFNVISELLKNKVKPENISWGFCGFSNGHKVENNKDKFFPIEGTASYTLLSAAKYAFMWAFTDDIDFVKNYKTEKLESIKRTYRDTVINPIHNIMKNPAGFSPINADFLKLGFEAAWVFDQWQTYPVLMLSDDGNLEGEGYKWGIPGENRTVSRPSPEQWEFLADYFIRTGKNHIFEHLPLDRWAYSENCKVFMAWSKVYKKYYKSYPQNYGAYPMPVDGNPLQPVDPDDPEVPDSNSEIPNNSTEKKNTIPQEIIWGGAFIALGSILAILLKKKNK